VVTRAARGQFDGSRVGCRPGRSAVRSVRTGPQGPFQTAQRVCVPMGLGRLGVGWRGGAWRAQPGGQPRAERGMDPLVWLALRLAFGRASSPAPEALRSM
jgi:hypothetical protein